MLCRVPWCVVPDLDNYKHNIPEGFSFSNIVVRSLNLAQGIYLIEATVFTL